MLTKLEAKGYKSFEHIRLTFDPLTVIVGPNNAGKSNLFDLLGLLSRIAQGPLEKAFSPDYHRGDPVEAFWQGQEVKKPTMEVTLEFDLSGVPHPIDPQREVPYPFVRYQLKVEFDRDRFLLLVADERLEDINPRKTKRRRNPLLEALTDENVVKVVPERGGKPRRLPLRGTRSVMTVVDDSEFYPTLCAVQQELASWRFYHFDPAALRQPNPQMTMLDIESSGRGLSGFLDTLQRMPDYAPRFEAIQRQLQRAIPEVEKLEVLDTGDKRRLLALSQKDSTQYTARVISDGSLRFLALLALAYSPMPPALVCFEEPENGVHPWRLQFVVEQLRSIARERKNGRRSQVLVNSHSPYLVDLLEIDEMRTATMGDKGTVFQEIRNDLFSNKPMLKKMLEDGETTLGEAWYRGDLHGNP